MPKNSSVTFYLNSINFLGSDDIGKISFIQHINNIIFSHSKQNFMKIEYHKLFFDDFDSFALHMWSL